MSMEQTVETNDQALGLLVQAAQLAQNRGAFNLDEAALVAQAVRHFAPPAPPEEVTEESAEEESE